MLTLNYIQRILARVPSRIDAMAMCGIAPEMCKAQSGVQPVTSLFDASSPCRLLQPFDEFGGLLQALAGPHAAPGTNLDLGRSAVTIIVVIWPCLRRVVLIIGSSLQTIHGENCEKYVKNCEEPRARGHDDLLAAVAKRAKEKTGRREKKRWQSCEEK